MQKKFPKNDTGSLFPLVTILESELDNPDPLKSQAKLEEPVH